MNIKTILVQLLNIIVDFEEIRIPINIRIIIRKKQIEYAV